MGGFDMDWLYEHEGAARRRWALRTIECLKWLDGFVREQAHLTAQLWADFGGGPGPRPGHKPGETFKCVLCGKTKAVHTKEIGGIGYALAEPVCSQFLCEHGIAVLPGRLCYTCCARVDRGRMGAVGKIVLYWDGKKVTNWPGTAKFRALRVSRGRHNIGRTREDVWFRGPDKHIWHGVQIGDFNQLLHCRRTKAVA